MHLPEHVKEHLKTFKFDIGSWGFYDQESTLSWSFPSKKEGIMFGALETPWWLHYIPPDGTDWMVPPSHHT